MSYCDFWIYYLGKLTLVQRSGCSFLTAYLLVVVCLKFFIPMMKKYCSQPIRKEGVESHMIKAGTPTLGGAIVFLIFFLSCFIWIADWNTIVLSILGVVFGFCLLGLVDDILKLVYKNTKGLNGKIKLFIGFIIAFIGSYTTTQHMPHEISYALCMPYIYHFFVGIGFTYLLFTSFVIVSCANAVNLSDGLDGLASLLTITIFATFFILLTTFIIPLNSLCINVDTNKYLDHISEITIILSSIIGALLGFLWYNSYPAKLFMGDLGSLGLGGALGIIAVALKQELFLIISSIVLIIETLSVILQVYSFKIRKKRIFLIAPIHHHFEKKGFHENHVVMRMWIFTIIMCIISLLLCCMPTL